MNCELCKQPVAETFLKKVVGTYIKDKKGKQHLVCRACQKRLGAKVVDEFKK